MSKTYSMHPTEETCWLHRRTLLHHVEFSDGQSGLYCDACGGPSHPPAPGPSEALARYERQIDRRHFWRRVLTAMGWRA